MAWLRPIGGAMALLALVGCGACDTTPGVTPDGEVIGFDGGDSGARGPEGGMDVPTTDGASVELGTSARGFVAVDDGDTLELARGCQGGQHVWISLRIRNLEPRSAIVQLQMLRIPDGHPIACDAMMPGTVCRPLESCNGTCQNAYPFQVRTTFDVVPTGEYGQISGLTLQTPDPDGLLETDVLIRARIVDRMMRSAETSRTVRVVWGTETCGSMRDGAPPPLGDGGLIPMADAGPPAD